MDHPKDHSLFGLGLPGYLKNLLANSLPGENVKLVAVHGETPDGFVRRKLVKNTCDFFVPCNSRKARLLKFLESRIFLYNR